MPLTDVAIRKAAPREKPYRLADGGGMYLEVSPSGGKYWRLKYRFLGKEKRLALGVYPDVPLAAAREKREDARKKLAAGVDPGEAKKADKRAALLAATNSFEMVALGWMDELKPYVTAGSMAKTKARFEKDVFSLAREAAGSGDRRTRSLGDPQADRQPWCPFYRSQGSWRNQSRIPLWDQGRLL